MNATTPLRFRPTARYWRSFLGSNFLLLAGIGLAIYVAGWHWNRPSAAVLLAGLGLYLLWRIIPYIFQVYRSWVELTPEEIRYRLNGTSGTVVYSEIEAYYTYLHHGSPPKQWLTLTLPDREIYISTDLFDTNAIHDALKSRIPDAAQQPESLPESQFYQQQQLRVEQWRGTAAAITVRAYSWGWAVVMTFGVLLFLGIIAANIATYSDGSLPLIVCMVPFLLLCLYAFAHNGTISADSTTIRYTSILAREEIKWDEVQRIEFDHNGQYCAFVGQGKRLVLPGLMYWSGKQKQRFLDFLEYETARRELEVKRRIMLFNFSQNTRVGW